MNKLWMVLVVCATFSLAGSLIPCPDCEKMVSRRALMCPNCGLKGEAIAGLAKTIPEPTIGDVLDVDCDGKKSSALPVEMDGRKFAVLPLDNVLGASQLRLWKNGVPIAWSVPELAEDAPIVRLQIAATNLTYWSVGGNLSFDGTLVNPKGNEVAAIVSSLVATNAFTLSNREWQILQPKQMKSHGRQVLKMLKGDPSDFPQRPHPYFKMIENMNKENAR